MQKVYNIASYFSKLGDCLQFTTLPVKLTETFGAEVNLYEGPNVKPFSSQEIRDFVWGTNPYIKNFGVTENWNAGDVPGLKYENVTDSFIQNWELSHGLLPLNNLPKIYVTPKKLIGISHLIELSSNTLQYDSEKIKKLVSGICVSGNNININIKQIVSPHQVNPIIIPGIELIKVSNIWDLWDLLCNCEHLSTLNSGTHSLAAAAFRFNPKMKHLSFLPNKDKDWIIEQKKFIYPGINYFDEDGNQVYTESL